MIKREAKKKMKDQKTKFEKHHWMDIKSPHQAISFSD